MRVHKISNVNKALDFIASKGVKLVSIGAEGERHPRCCCCPIGDSPCLFVPRRCRSASCYHGDRAAYCAV